LNKQLFYLSIFLVFILFLSGCNSIIVGNTEIDIELETKRVKDVVDGFWEAIDAQDGWKAYWYCSENGYKQFVEPYGENIILLKQLCPNVIIDVYSVINANDICFEWDKLGNPRAIAEVQVNRTIMNCGDLDSTKAEFGTMELSYYGGAADVWWIVDKVDIDLVDDINL
jgi:hypothetical protein